MAARALLEGAGEAIYLRDKITWALGDTAVGISELLSKCVLGENAMWV